MLKRTVIKLSGEAIGSGECNYNDVVIDSIVRQIGQVMQAGTQVALVIGGGNIWRGARNGRAVDRVKADQMGMLATVMNGVYLSEAFRRQGQKAKVVTPMPFANVSHVYEKDTALEWMAKGEVLINAAGVGHPFFSTDTVTALRAAELEVDCVLYAKSVDGVYNHDPSKNGQAKKFKTLSYRTAITQSLKAADMAALHLACEAGIPSYVFGLDMPESIVLACSFPETGNLQGTYIHVDAEEDYYAG